VSETLRKERKYTEEQIAAELAPLQAEIEWREQQPIVQ
jgi:hypothetical protein